MPMFPGAIGAKKRNAWHHMFVRSVDCLPGRSYVWSWADIAGELFPAKIASSAPVPLPGRQMPRRSRQWLAHFGPDEPRGREDPLLRKATLNRILTTDKRQWFRDDRIPGFALMITKQGKQSFTYDYRRPDGKTKRRTFKRGTGRAVNRAKKQARQCAP